MNLRNILYDTMIFGEAHHKRLQDSYWVVSESPGRMLTNRELICPYMILVSYIRETVVQRHPISLHEPHD